MSIELISSRLDHLNCTPKPAAVVRCSERLRQLKEKDLIKKTLSVDEATAGKIRTLIGPGPLRFETSDNGVSNSVYFAKTDEGTKAVLKIFTKADMPRVQKICSVTDALRAKDVATPQVLGLFENTKKEPVLMMEFIKGTHSELQSERYQAVGRAMARLHTADIGKPELPQVTYSPEFFEELFRLCKGWDKLPAIRECYDKIDMSYLQELPRSLVHGDFSQTNVITDKQGLVHLIDFDHVHYDYSLTDLARAQLFFGFDKTTMHEETIQDMVRGYNEIKPLTEAEKRYFYRHLTLIVVWGLLDEYYHIHIKGDLSGPRFEANQFNRSTSIDYLLKKLEVLKNRESIEF